ncbi:MAG: hypothetical protein HWD61_08965 [Parachlamydiaceae bacterium]|nr:MAG: hypothetical protein HWD61_08965 [Parachlamydiaceae bacterium]
MEGDHEAFYPDGTLASSCRYHLGLKEGQAQAWHENGVLKEDLFFNFGLLNDEKTHPACTQYYPDRMTKEYQEFFWAASRTACKISS